MSKPPAQAGSLLEQVAQDCGQMEMKMGTQGRSGEKGTPFPVWVMPSVVLQYFHCIIAVTIQFQIF